MKDYLKRAGFDTLSLQEGSKKTAISDLPYQAGVAQQWCDDEPSWSKEGLKEENQETAADEKAEEM